VARAPLTRKRLLGLDRSGPPPPETLSLPVPPSSQSSPPSP